MKDDSVYLTHVLRCIGRIEEYLAGDPSSMLSSDMVRDAVLRNLQTMAESTQRLSTEAKARATTVDWKALAGFRNVLVHDYLGIDIFLVQRALEEQLPGLKQAVESLLHELTNRGH